MNPRPGDVLTHSLGKKGRMTIQKAGQSKGERKSSRKTQTLSGFQGKKGGRREGVEKEQKRENFMGWENKKVKRKKGENQTTVSFSP